jgi:hypothetical protein
MSDETRMEAIVPGRSGMGRFRQFGNRYSQNERWYVGPGWLMAMLSAS